ncbi:hypothetical protein F9L33_14720 [Amylibacter sp. SFDW26]|uniref:alginate O-acetyltransferase AlgX-related protein n=1 Tax=Amylibacter sp. SFDW26 TaxID=2652722 RepID=UPI001262871C|nr:hypothetical protein [Amylibacter sp. SFDW26]KAB7610145.1 hypothetical protein F9L33_14720 [Amylibacter sp. SFDW26]
MDRLKNKYQQAFCSAFLIGVVTLGLFSHENMKPHGSASVLTGKLQGLYEDGFSASNPLRQSSVNIWGAFKYAILGQASNGAIVGRDDWLFTTEELSYEPDQVSNLDASVQEIINVYAELQDREIKLIPVIVPDKARVYEEKLKHVRGEEVSNRYYTLISKLNDNKIATISGLSPLERNKSIADVFMRDDTHWSPFGAKTVARHIADYIQPGAFDLVQVKTKQIDTKIFDGDLLKYVPTGFLRPYVGPAQNTIERFETTVQNNASLFGNTAIDVVLVGTSFSAKSDWHFEGFLKQALSVDILNMSQEGKGPFAPMRDYLKSDTFENTPPKLIIWEIPERYTTQDLPK